jgi:hypothetical protein
MAAGGAERRNPVEENEGAQPQSPDTPPSSGSGDRSGNEITALPGESRLPQALQHGQRDSLQRSTRCDEHGGSFVQRR